jgi:serine/threonine-protein kinase
MEHRLTANGEFYGSPPYTAPELLTGKEPTPASDRYAFAATAMEVLTGELPHPGENMMAMLHHILKEPPVIPASCSAEIGKVFSKALANDPEDRHINLVDFLRDLIEALPTPDATKEKLLESLAQGDVSGDIVPIRRLQKRADAPLVQASKSTGPSYLGPIQISLATEDPALQPDARNSGRFQAVGSAEATQGAPAPAAPPASAGNPWTPKRIAVVVILGLLGLELLWFLWGLIQGMLSPS